MASEVDVGLLADHVELLDAMSAHCLAEWADLYLLDDGVTDVAGARRLFGAATENRDRVPIAMVAFQRDPATGAKTFLGCAQIIDSDMPQARPELTPWLASVTVVPHARRQGLADRLVRAAQAWAFTALPTVDKVWLWTDNLRAVELYRRHGWTDCERVVYHGHHAVLMVCSRQVYLERTSSPRPTPPRATTEG